MVTSVLLSDTEINRQQGGLVSLQEDLDDIQSKIEKKSTKQNVKIYSSLLLQPEYCIVSRESVDSSRSEQPLHDQVDLGFKFQKEERLGCEECIRQTS